MDTRLATIIAAEVNASLDSAEAIWQQHGREMKKTAMIEAAERTSRRVLPSPIPGHPLVSDDKATLDHFIALVADMRNSTQHMLQAIGDGRPSQFERVLYETHALLPALALTIEYHDGSITEYLGDGLLSLFSFSKDKNRAMGSAYNSAVDCIAATNDVVNPILSKRYRLPPLVIGVGLALSPALVTLVGTARFQQPKVIGECVYRASKLSGGNGVIGVDSPLRNAWPGPLPNQKPSIVFTNFTFRSLPGYRIDKA